MMAMVVTCESCGARFLMKQTLFRDAKGARIRCRKCGGHIAVWVPGASPAPPSPEVSAPVVPQKPEPVPSPPRGQAVPPVSAGIAAEPEIVPAAAAAPEPVAATHVPAEVEAPAARQSNVPAFDLLKAVPVVAPAPGSSRKAQEAELGAVKRRFTASPRPPRVIIFLVVSVILLLAGGAFFFLDTKDTRERMGGSSPPPGPAATANPVSAEEKPAYVICETNLANVKALNGENLFVIQGTVANIGKGPSPGIRIHAVLLGKDNQALANNTVFAGNQVDNTTIRYAKRTVVEGLLGMRYGEGNANRDIPTGKSLPFMVVFFDPPEQIESYTVKAQDAD